MAKKNTWKLLVFASEAYPVVVPVFLLVCAFYFGFHEILNIHTFGNRMQKQAIVDSFIVVELLNVLCLIILLSNLTMGLLKNPAQKKSSGLFFLGLNALVSILLYPMTIYVPI